MYFKPTIYNFIPSSGEESRYVCNDCVDTEKGHTEGAVPDYGDEECSDCGYHTGDEEEEG